jgi:hypothetical protein
MLMSGYGIFAKGLWPPDLDLIKQGKQERGRGSSAAIPPWYGDICK